MCFESFHSEARVACLSQSFDIQVERKQRSLSRSLEYMALIITEFGEESAETQRKPDAPKKLVKQLESKVNRATD